MEVSLDSHGLEERAMGTDCTGIAWQDRRSRTQRRRQSLVCGRGVVGSADRRAVARSAGRIRQMVHGVHALLAMGAKGRVGAAFQASVGGSRLRICPHRCDVGPGPSAWHRRKMGTQNQAIGKSRGGLTTKIAVIVDALGNLIRFVLMPGQRHDITSFDALMAGIYCLALIGDKGFDPGWLRERLRANDTEAVIPLRRGPADTPSTTGKNTSGDISSKTSSAASKPFDVS